MISDFVIFSFSIFGNSLVISRPISITANGCTPCVTKEINATDVIVPAKVENTPPNELSISFTRFKPMTFGPLVFNNFVKDLRKDFMSAKIKTPTKNSVMLDHNTVWLKTCS